MIQKRQLAWKKKKKKVKNEVDLSQILPLDPNIPDPFSTGCKCHPPSGKYIREKNIH